METGGELAKIRDENNDYSAPVYAGGGGICVDTVKKSLCRRLWARDIIQNLRPIKNNTEKSTEIWLHLMFYTCDYKFLIFPYFSSAGNCGT